MPFRSASGGIMPMCASGRGSAVLHFKSYRREKTNFAERRMNHGVRGGQNIRPWLFDESGPLYT